MFKHSFAAAGIAAALLSPATQAAEPVWDGNTISMLSEPLAPGVFAFYASDAKALNDKGGVAGTSAGLIAGSSLKR